MPPWATDAVLVALITGMLGIIGGRISSSASMRTASVQAAARERELITAPYEALASRVSQLEDETFAQQTEIVGLRAEIESLRAARAADVRAWAARDTCWQSAWDDLRDNWLERRAVESPPQYPVERISNNYTDGGAR